MKLRLPTEPTQNSRIRHALGHGRHWSRRDVASVTLGHPESRPAGIDVTKQRHNASGIPESSVRGYCLQVEDGGRSHGPEICE